MTQKLIVFYNGVREGQITIKSGLGLIEFNWEWVGAGLLVSFPDESEWTSFCGKHQAEWAKHLREEIKSAIKSHKDFKFKNIEDRRNYLLFCD